MVFGAFQNFKDRFLSRGGGKLNAYVLSAYGKLPIYKDYIIWECHMGGADEFKRWLDEAFGLVWEELGGKSVRLRGRVDCLVLTPGGKHAIAASVWPSADEGGLRKFPFALFTVFPRGDIIGRGVRGAIEAMEPIWRSFCEEYEGLKQCENIEDLYAYLQQSTPRLEEAASPATELPEPVAEWFEALQPRGAASWRRRIEEGVRNTLAAYRGFPEQGESLAVRLPLARAFGTGAQAELWSGLFKNNLKKCPVFPSIIIEYPEGEPHGTISLVWRPIQREDGRLFAEYVESYEFIEDLVPAAASAGAADGGDGDGITEGNDNPELSVKDWAEGLGK